MSEEIKEIKEIVEKYMADLKGISDLRIIVAKRINSHWKVVVRYASAEDPEITSMLIINWKTKDVDTFRQDIMLY